MLRRIDPACNSVITLKVIPNCKSDPAELISLRNIDTLTIQV